MASYIAYYRVSTQRQGQSGLGLDAQRSAVASHVGTGTLLAEYTEVETAKKSTMKNRPQLTSAIADAKRQKATLLIAKLDRLARNVYFVSGLMESGVDFVAVDMPQANRLTIHVMAAFAEHEAQAISDRTKVGLKAANARGTQLGNPHWQESIEAARVKNNPTPLASELVEMIQRYRAESATLRDIAGKLNTLGLRTPKGNVWYASTVRSALGSVAA